MKSSTHQVQLKKPYYEPYEAATKHLWVEPRKSSLPHASRAYFEFPIADLVDPGKIEFWESVPGWQLQKPGFLD